MPSCRDITFVSQLFNLFRQVFEWINIASIMVGGVLLGRPCKFFAFLGKKNDNLSAFK